VEPASAPSGHWPRLHARSEHPARKGVRRAYYGAAERCTRTQSLNNAPVVLVLVQIIVHAPTRTHTTTLSCGLLSRERDPPAAPARDARPIRPSASPPPPPRSTDGMPPPARWQRPRALDESSRQPRNWNPRATITFTQHAQQHAHAHTTCQATCTCCYMFTYNMYMYMSVDDRPCLSSPHTRASLSLSLTLTPDIH
jgi:hypothetical protein